MANYKGLKVTGDRRGFMQAFGNAVVYRDQTTPSAALALNDTVDLLLVPAGTRLLQLAIWNGDMDTGATLQYSLGYRSAQADGVLAASAAYFVAAGATTLQAAVTQAAPTRFSFTEITFNEDVYITMTIGAAATGVSGTPSIYAEALGEARGTR